MKLAETIKPDVARTMLTRSQVNRIERLTRGGTLTKKEERELKTLLRRSERMAKATAAEAQAGKKKHGKRRLPTAKTVPALKWEGNFDQRQRRYKVFLAKLGGLNVREIAEEVGINKDTVCQDLQALEQSLAATLDPKQADKFLNEMLLTFETMKLMAMENAIDSEGNERCGFLNTASHMVEQQVRLLQDAGILKKAATTHRLTGPNGDPLPAATGGTFVFRVVDASGEKIPTYNITDAEGADDE